MTRSAGTRCLIIAGLLLLGAGLRFEAPLVDITETTDGYTLEYPQGGVLFLSSLRIQAARISVAVLGKKVEQAALREARFEGTVSLTFPESNQITADYGFYEDPVLRLEGHVTCAVGEWRCEAESVVFLTNENTLELKNGSLQGESLNISGENLTFPLKGEIRATGTVQFEGAGMKGECNDLAFNPDSMEATLKNAQLNAEGPGIKLKGTEIRLLDRLKTLVVTGDIEATITGIYAG